MHKCNKLSEFVSRAVMTKYSTRSKVFLHRGRVGCKNTLDNLLYSSSP